MRISTREVRGFKSLREDIFSVCDHKISKNKHSAILLLHTSAADSIVNSGLSKKMTEKYPTCLDNFLISKQKKLGSIQTIELYKNQINNTKLVLCNIICHQKFAKHDLSERNFHYVAFAHGMMQIVSYIDKLKKQGYDDIEILMPVISGHNTGANWSFISEILRDMKLTNISFYSKEHYAN